MPAVDYFVLFVQLFWGISETVILIKKKSTENNAIDTISAGLLSFVLCFSIGLGIFVGIAIKTTTWLNVYCDSVWFPIFGCVLMVVGIVIRLSAIATLKKYFTVNVTIQRDHTLITNGLYRWIRHPAYAGSILTLVGCGICYGNIVSIVIIVVPYTVLILKRIAYEETLLEDRFGTSYRDFKSKTKRLVPCIY